MEEWMGEGGRRVVVVGGGGGEEGEKEAWGEVADGCSLVLGRLPIGMEKKRRSCI